MPGKATEIRPSDKGRYFTALLRLAGGIHRANEIFLGKFWKDQFEALGATPAVTEARRDQVTRDLLVGKDLPRVYQFSTDGHLVIKSARPEEHWSVKWEHY